MPSFNGNSHSGRRAQGGLAVVGRRSNVDSWKSTSIFVHVYAFTTRLDATQLSRVLPVNTNQFQNLT